MKIESILLAVAISVFPAIAYGDDAADLWAHLKIDPLLSAYLQDGCSLNCTVSNDGGTTGMNGCFVVRDPHGKILLEGTYVRDRFVGDLKSFDGNGNLVALERYSGGKPVGDRFEWDETGGLRLVTHFDARGEKTGTEVAYLHGAIVAEIDWENGQPVEKRLYKDGKVVERITGSKIIERLKIKNSREGEGMDAGARTGSDHSTK